jgi:hypothetical protein
MKTQTHSRTTYTIPGTDIEVELPVTPDSIMDFKAPLVRITDDQIILGYLAHDDDCENPLEDDEYAGYIYEARRRGKTLRDYERALALGDFEDDERDPYAVLLDVYEHGGISYSLAGAGMQSQFDTARGGAVWVPGDLLRKDIEAHADPMARARECAKIDAEQYTDWCNGNCYSIVVVTYDKKGQQIDWNTCSGYVGDDNAYEALQGAMPREVAHG